MSITVSELKSKESIMSTLLSFDQYFSPPISVKVNDLSAYASKLCKNAYVYIAEEVDILGFASMYANDYKTNIAYIPFIAVHKGARNKNVGSQLLNTCKERSRDNGMKKIKLEVKKSNLIAQAFYRKNGFRNDGDSSVDSIYMVCDL